MRIAVFLLLVATSTFAATLHVPDDYADILSGLENASPDDTVLVAPGTYTGENNRNLLVSEGRHLIGAAGSTTTILDLEEDDGFAIEIEDALVKGFTIRNGTGDAIRIDSNDPTTVEDILISNMDSTNWEPWHYLIRAESSSSLEFRNVRVTDSNADTIGLILANSAHLDDCSFINAEGQAHCLVFLSQQIVIEDTEFISCTNGALYLEGHSTITNCSFLDNESWLFHAGGYFGNDGGAIIVFGGEATISDSRFVGNIADDFDSYGGAVSAQGAEVTCERCVFGGNVARWGGAFCARDSYCQILSCTFFENACLEGCDPVNRGTIYSLESSFTMVFQCILSFSQNSAGVAAWSEGSALVGWCVAYENDGGTFGGHTEDITGSALLENPLFCMDDNPEPFTVSSNSPCLPENNQWGRLVGVFGAGCTFTATDGLTWSRLKTLY